VVVVIEEGVAEVPDEEAARTRTRNGDYRWFMQQSRQQEADRVAGSPSPSSVVS
jgi:hypothetical protein